MIKPFLQYIDHPNFLFNKKVMELFCQNTHILSQFRLTSPNYNFGAFVYQPDKNKLEEAVRAIRKQIEWVSLRDAKVATQMKLPNIDYYLGTTFSAIKDNNISDIDLIFSYNLSENISSKEEFDGLMNLLLDISSNYSILWYFMDVNEANVPQNYFNEFMERSDIILDDASYFASAKNIERKNMEEVDREKPVDFNEEKLISKIITDSISLKFYDIAISFSKA